MKRLQALIQGVIAAGVVLAGAACLGLAVRVFLWAAGLGG